MMWKHAHNNCLYNRKYVFWKTKHEPQNNAEASVTWFKENQTVTNLESFDGWLCLWLAAYLMHFV